MPLPGLGVLPAIPGCSWACGFISAACTPHPHVAASPCVRVLASVHKPPSPFSCKDTTHWMQGPP